jgi:hypothetical protein
MTTPAPASKLASATLPGVNVMLMGPAGTGKTRSIGTFVDAFPDGEVFVLSLENGLETLMGYWTDRGKPIPDNLRWHSLKSADVSFADMQANAEKVNTMSLEALAKLPDPNRSRHNQFVELFRALNNFRDDRTGKEFGAVNTWKPDRALFIDGLTGLNNAALSLVVGGKAVRSQSDWGIAQQQLEGLLRKLCDGCACHFGLMAHVERETDAVLGGVKLMASTLGKALAPKIPAMFSDVILTVRQGDKWSWDTASPMADLKTRNLAFKSDISPDFAQILAKWRQRAGVV